MSIFGDIMGSIFGYAKAGSGPAATPAAGPAARSSAPTPAAGQPAGPVDVEVALAHLASQNPEKLDWRKSIIDLMKLLNLDSSLEARKKLAEELHYPGNMDESASMNLWLHKQVMIKLTQNSLPGDPVIDPPPPRPRPGSGSAR